MAGEVPSLDGESLLSSDRRPHVINISDITSTNKMWLLVPVGLEAKNNSAGLKTSRKLPHPATCES